MAEFLENRHISKLINMSCKVCVKFQYADGTVSLR